MQTLAAVAMLNAACRHLSKRGLLAADDLFTHYAIRLDVADWTFADGAFALNEKEAE